MKKIKKITSLVAMLLAVMMLLSGCIAKISKKSNAENENKGSSKSSSKEADSSSTDDTVSNSSLDKDVIIYAPIVPNIDDIYVPESSHTQSYESKIPIAPAPSSSRPTSVTQSQNTVINSSNTGFNNRNEAKIYNSLPNRTEVHILMYRKYTKTEQQLVNDYQKKTGVKIKTTVTTEKEYPTKLISMVGGGNSPDVVCFSSGHFPGLVTKSLQPLEEDVFQLKSDCWNYTYMDAYKINGRYFGVAMPGTWSCEDLAYVTYYNPTILKLCGISTHALSALHPG